MMSVEPSGIAPGLESSLFPMKAPHVVFSIFLIVPTAPTLIFAHRFALIGFDTTSPTVNSIGPDLALEHQPFFVQSHLVINLTRRDNSDLLEVQENFDAVNSSAVYIWERNSSLALVPARLPHVGVGYCAYAQSNMTFTQEEKVSMQIVKLYSSYFDHFPRFFLTQTPAQTMRSLNLCHRLTSMLMYVYYYHHWALHSTNIIISYSSPLWYWWSLC
jgi:hypothetical protein